MSDYTVPVKMNLNHLSIELTRECNLHCAHCMRGDVQNVTITPEIIDKLLDNVNAIWKLHLTGGEPFLHPEVIEYLFDRIIERKIFVLVVDCITNGTICDQRIVNTFSKMARYVKNNENMLKNKRVITVNGQSFSIDPESVESVVQIVISTDSWHEDSPFYFPEATFHFYKQNCSNDITVTYQYEELIFGTAPKRDKKRSITYTGRAKNFLPDPDMPFMVDSWQHRFAMGDSEGDMTCPKHKADFFSFLKVLTVVPLQVMCQVEISSKGGIHNGGMQSFNEIDTMSQDNILDCSLYDAIWNWNHRYPILCIEAERYYRNPSVILANKIDSNPVFAEFRRSHNISIFTSESSAQKGVSAFYDLIWVRQQIQNLYQDGFIPFSTIQEATKDTFNDALELPAHDLESRQMLLQKALAKTKSFLSSNKIDPTTKPNLSLMEMLQKY